MGIGIAILAWAGYCLVYVLSPRPPFEFAGDIGSAINALGRMQAAAATPQALSTTVSWHSWLDFPSFILFSFGTMLAAFPLESIVRDPFRTMKLVQVIQLTIAFAGAAWLFGSLFGKSRWCILAGWVYAAMPFCTLAVRGECDFGSIFALVPVVLAANITLARRHAGRALPLAGLLCAFVGGSFFGEYLAFVGVPLLLVTFALFRHAGTRLSLWSVGGSIVAFVAFPTYYVLPTVLGPHPMWLSPSYASGISTSPELQLFSQGPLEELAAISRENLLSAGDLNPSRSFPFALAAGCVVWMLAIGGALRACLSGSRWWWPIGAVAALWTLLAFGPRLPVFDATVWRVLPHVPLLGTLRTPDRFAHVVAIFLALGATSTIVWLSRTGGLGKAAALLCAAVICLGFLAFDINERVLGFGDLDARLPDQRAASELAREIGGRTAVFGFTRGGSILDFPPYAPLNTTVYFAWDLGARYVNEDAGLGLLRRAAVRSVLTSPVWTTNSAPGMPADMGEPVSRSASAKPARLFPSGVRLFTIEGARAMQSPVAPLCTYAGPFGFGLAAREPWLDGAALVHGGGAGCASALYGDYDPMDEMIPSDAISTWPGSTFGVGVPLPPPASFEIERMTLTAPWYRYAYSGDSLLSRSPFSTQGEVRSQPFTFTTAREGRFTLYARTSGIGTLATLDGSGHIVTGFSERVDGFEWLALPLGRLSPGTHDDALSIVRPGQAGAPFVVDELALVSGDIATHAPPSASALVSYREFKPPLRSSDRVLQWLFPRLQAGDPTVLAQGAMLDSATTLGMFRGEPEIRSFASLTHVRFRWFGAPGQYVGAAAAWLAGPGSSLALSVENQTVAAEYDPTRGDVSTPVYGAFFLRRGDVVDVTMRTGSGSSAPNALAALLFAPVQTTETATDYDARSEGWRFDTGNDLALYEALHAPGLVAGGNGFRAVRNAAGTTRFAPDFIGGIVTANIGSAGRFGTASLRCGSSLSRAVLGSATSGATVTSLAVRRNGNESCSLALQWRSRTFSIGSIALNARSPVAAGWSARQYLSAGDYVWTSNASHDERGVTLDGAPWPAGARLHVRAGFHTIAFSQAPAPVPGFVIRNVAWNAVPSYAHTMELAQLYDGYWVAENGGVSVRGYECDLVNTCFDGVPANAEVHHELPPPLAWGFAIALTDIAACCAILFLGARRTKTAL